MASITVPKEQDYPWQVLWDAEDTLWFEKPSPGAAGILITRIAVVYEGGCESDRKRTIGDRPQDLINWVQSAPQFDTSEPGSAVRLGRSASVSKPPS